MSKRYRLICVADFPDLGSYDDLDEAIVNSTAHYDVWDSETGEWLSPTCQEEMDGARERLRRKRETESAPPTRRER